MKIQSKILGELQQSSFFEDWWQSNPIYVPYFGKELCFHIMDVFADDMDDMLPIVEKMVQNILAKTENDRLQASDAVYENCMDFLEMIDYDEDHKAMWDIKDPHQIWKHVRVNGIYVALDTSYYYGGETIDNANILKVSCGCDWEEEHGLQLTFANGKTLVEVSEHY